MWEMDRFDWGKLHAKGSSARVPDALVELASASTEEQADAAYWRIDNVVVVQGTLYEAAVPTTACLVALLPKCNNVVRERVLELLVQLGSGESAPNVDVDVAAECRREILLGYCEYAHLLESGEDRERVHAVDLMGLCATADPTLGGRVKWYFRRSLEGERDAGVRVLLNNWIVEL
jgi:hypothetical protein